MILKNIHDRVIDEIQKVLNQLNYDIYTNPGQEKNVSIGENYPDIIMTEKNRENVEFILEVETEDSITIIEANQWKKYTKEINATFYLVVPEQYLSKAQRLCQQVGVNARFATYTSGSLGELHFKFN